ncbi:hypothetical protein Isop_3399 [Isosphaera pallida ATCC 43644]|uniref:Cell division protein FtsQ n=1 Tax=Isosphaera pallida (strain ATCC 43644 / DSM 9630 / IS1B) TaxID=575540 RepID=E8R6Q6_ISOPI|nr:hypothetical protein [Isosphaera pallida]ADV63958.1 hypothetical protein Isop_3399 [Isosphaera pallida ATCC 43644]
MPRSAWRRGGILVVAMVALVLGWWFRDQPRSWLARHDIYRTTAEAIEWRPEPPDWIRPSASDLAIQVAQRAAWPDRFSPLEIDLDRLADDVRFHCPWIDAVERVERVWPNRLILHVRYRKPAARLVFGDGQAEAILDQHGVVLPAREVEERVAADLVRLILKNDNPDRLDLGLDPNREPGRHAARSGSTNPNAPEAQRLRNAIHLAMFLRDQRDALRDSSRTTSEDADLARADALWLERVAVNPTDPRGLFIWIQSRTWIVWGRSLDRADPEGEPSNLEKWPVFRHLGRRLVARGIPPTPVVFDLSRREFLLGGLLEENETQQAPTSPTTP